MATEVPATSTPSTGGLTLETRGIEIVGEADRKGRPRDLFWPWFAANVSVLGISYGAFILAFGVSFWQGVFAAIVGTVVLLPARRLRRARRQVGVRADDGLSPGAVRGARQRPADRGLVRPARRLGDGADLAGHAGHRDGLRAARRRRRQRNQDRRLPRGRGRDRRGRRARVRCHPAAAALPDDRARRPHGGLHRADREGRALGRRERVARAAPARRCSAPSSSR